jgi:tRNA modification GTPase
VTSRQAESAIVAGTAERCRESLQAARAAIERAQAAARASLGEELVAAELRLALGELGAVVGAVYTDDILDRVFSRFCIGK